MPGLGIDPGLIGAKRRKIRYASLLPLFRPNSDMHLQSTADTSIKYTIFTSIYSHAKHVYLHVFDIADNVFERELIVCSFMQDLSKEKGSTSVV